MQQIQKDCAPLREFYTKADLLLILILLLGLMVATVGRERGSTALIEAESGTWRLPLAGSDELIRVEGPLGVTEVVVGGGRALIKSSPCSDQLCVGWGEIHKKGQVLLCAPNRVSVRIEGGNYHGLTY